MPAKSMDLAWIVVKDLKKAVKFYTDVIGLKLLELSEEFNWAELEGKEGGARLGIAQMDEEGFEAGENAFLTFSVSDLLLAKTELEKKGAKFIGEVEEVPGHVRMLMVIDLDGNRFQLVQKLAD
jgi:predicted enzyme related to lactoylglutathione lyase